jgi:hypothetical protein
MMFSMQQYRQVKQYFLVERQPHICVDEHAIAGSTFYQVRAYSLCSIKFAITRFTAIVSNAFRHVPLLAIPVVQQNYQIKNDTSELLHADINFPARP